MILWLQVKGLVATGLLALMGLSLMIEKMGATDLPNRPWIDRIGWFVLGAIFVVPFIAVVVSVWISRHG
jgi:hypothetical protein